MFFCFTKFYPGVFYLPFYNLLIGKALFKAAFCMKVVIKMITFLKLHSLDRLLAFSVSSQFLFSISLIYNGCFIRYKEHARVSWLLSHSLPLFGVCVCMREREGERGGERELFYILKTNKLHMKNHLVKVFFTVWGSQSDQRCDL